jgi:hypothetical protein
MAKMNMTGFYRKQEVLADIFKFRPGKAEVLIEPRRQSADEEGMWPDITVSVPVKKSAVVGNRTVLAPSAQKSAATVTKKAPNGKGSANARPIIGIKGTNGSITRSSTTAPAKPRALGERDRNAIVKKKVMNPALRDFENDQMGKIIKAKLQENRSNETDGFIL